MVQNKTLHGELFGGWGVCYFFEVVKKGYSRGGGRVIRGNTVCIVKIVESEVDFRVTAEQRLDESRYAAYLHYSGIRLFTSVQSQ